MSRFLSNFTPREPSRFGKRGFTLVELLVVFAIITILAGITFGIFRGVQNARDRATAKAELSVIAQALEQFKSRYGDYPWHASEGDWDDEHPEAQMMLYALTGRLMLERTTAADGSSRIRAIKVNNSLDNSDVQDNPKFLDPSKFSVTYLDGDEDKPMYLLDPWGNPYVYSYKSEDTENTEDPPWDVVGYHLYSMGPKGTDANDALKEKIDEASGVLDDDFREVVNEYGIIMSGE